MTSILGWADKNKGAAAFLGGMASATAAGLLWLAQGGAVAFLTSVTALAQADVASALALLPESQRRIEVLLEEIKDGQEDARVDLAALSDDVAGLRRELVRVVEWDIRASQELTDAVGECRAGESCPIYLRGRKTAEGEGCSLEVARPKLVLNSGREFPTHFEGEWQLLDFGTDFETAELFLSVPSYIPGGEVGVVVVSVYAQCPFAEDDETVNRQTPFRLNIEISPAS